ncbi:MAG TPA: hypothetical protein VNU19_06855 [Candidatus Acidoferrum sp.]|jgi:hypothetical protein|nr:hypothetical protein [Candidatus Acidoferrum sp.]
MNEAQIRERLRRAVGEPNYPAYLPSRVQARLSHSAPDVSPQASPRLSWLGGVARTLSVAAALLIVLLIAAIVLGVHVWLPNMRHSQPAGPGVHPSAAPSVAAAPTPTAYTPPSPVPLRNFSGTGSSTTAGWDTAGRWELIWSYDCANLRHAGSFRVVVYDETMKIVDPDVPPLSVSGKVGSGSQQFNTSSLYHLVVTTQCAWHVIVAYD